MQNLNSDESFRLLIDGLSDHAIYMLDPGGKVVNWNIGAERIHGWSAHDIIGQHFSLFYPPGASSLERQRHTLALAEQHGRHELQTERFRRDGSQFLAEVVITVLRDSAGVLSGYAKVIRDITTRQQTQNIENSNALLLAVLQSSPDIIFAKDRQRRVIVANPAYFAVFDRTPEQVIGFDVGAFAATTDIAQTFREMDERVIATGQPERFEQTFGEPGVERHYQTSLAPLLKSNGEIDGLVGVLSDVTEEKQAAARLRLSDERYRTLFNSIDEGFCVVEMIFDQQLKPVDYRFLEVNPSCEIQSGLRFVAGKLISELAPDLDPVWLDIYGKVALTGEPARFVSQSQITAGRWFDVYAGRLGGPDSRKVAVLFNDITARRRSELALQSSEAKLRLGISVAGLGLGTIDYLSDTITLDDAAAGLFGLAAHTPLSRTDLHARFHPDDAAAIQAKIAEALDPGGNGSMALDHRIVRPDGQIRWISARKQVEFANVNGVRQATAGSLAVIDITDHQHAEQQLRVSEIRYRRLFEAAQDGVLLLDPETRQITDANPFMQKLLDYSYDQLVGKELFEIGLLQDEVAAQDMFRKLKKNDHVRYEDLPLESQSGRHQEVEVVANVYDENGRSVIQCNIRDITERKKAEAHNRMLMAEVNHRSKNLLAVVQAVAKQTARLGNPATFVARLCERIDGLAASQDLLVKNDWMGVGVADLVAAQMAHFQDLIGSRVLIDGPPIRLTPAAAQGIGMALHELATNAAKYGALSNRDGRVRISWRVTGKEEPVFTLHWREEGGPKVVPPTHQGFGQLVLGRMVEAAVDGTVEIDYRESGLSWNLSGLAAAALEEVSRDAS